MLGSSEARSDARSNTPDVSAFSSEAIADNPVAVARPFTSEALQNWLDENAQALEAQHQNPAKIEVDVRAQVQALTPEQKNQLVQTVLDRQAPMNKRIFSNYALMLDDFTGAEAATAIERSRKIIQTPLPVFKNPAPHTLEETQRGQEYALRYMQIDQLFKLIKEGDAVAKAQSLLVLKSIANSERDLKIKSYAQQKLKEI